MSDYLVGWLLPGLLSRIRTAAPNVIVKVHHHHATEALAPDTDIHLLVCSDIISSQEFKRERLFSERFVFAFRKGHPASRSKPTLEDILKLAHIKVAHIKDGNMLVDATLARRGLSRNIVVTLPSYSGLLSIMANSDLCGLLPPSWLRLNDPRGELIIANAEIPDNEFTVDLFSKSARIPDSGLRWFEKLIREEFQALRSGKGSRVSACRRRKFK